ncbi:MAG TPA: hypothetical protein VGC42_32250 [Kofleriaceae bacterium]
MSNRTDLFGPYAGTSRALRPDMMNSSFEAFESISLDQLGDVTGGFSWKSLGLATASGAGTGAAGGAVEGAVNGVVAGGVGAIPGAAIGAAVGGIGGGVAAAASNVGQQLGWWS